MSGWCRPSWTWVVVCFVLSGVGVGCGGADAKGSRMTGSAAGVGGNAGSAGGGAGGLLGGAANGSAGTLGGVGGTAGVTQPPVVDSGAPPFVQDDTAASGLAPGVIDMLKAGGGACTVNAIYPYEGTIFPGGLQPPIVMWSGGADAAYVRMQYEGSDILDYQFAAGATNPGQLQIPREAWNEITRRTNRANLNVTLTVQTGGALSTCTLHWRVAAGNMVGALYYNTYQAPSPGIPGIGAIMRLTLGGVAEIYKQGAGAPPVGPCYSCHSVSFNGTVLVSSLHNYTPFFQSFVVEKFDVTSAVEPTASGTLHNANFGALTPDGSRILSMGNPQCTAGSDTFPRRPNNFPLVEGNDVARVLNTSTGEEIPAPGLDGANYMWMPQFSPDGDKVVFNHAKANGSGGTDRTQLAIMDYNYDTNTFSNLRVIVNAPEFAPGVPSFDYSPVGAGAGPQPAGVDMCTYDGTDDPSGVAFLPMGSCNGPCYPAWPFFTPDGKGVVFSLTSDPDFAQAFPGRDAPSKSDLWYVDTETLEVVRLDNANRGLDEIDQQNNYYPTVLPIAIGGYFWMFWTAVRDYGHLVQGRDPGAAPNSVLEAEKKRIWVSAIKPKLDNTNDELNQPGPLTDPSFPGFYVDGQSLSGNVRAFAALNPCLDNGAACASGLDCCCGYCSVDEASGAGTCTCEPPMCSKTNEKCETSDDCCPPESPDEPKNSCIGGFCTFIVVE